MESGYAQPWFYGMSHAFSISRNHPYTTGLCLGIDIELPVQVREVGQSLGPDEDGGEWFDCHGTCHFIHVPITCQGEENRAVVSTMRRP